VQLQPQEPEGPQAEAAAGEAPEARHVADCNAESKPFVPEVAERQPLLNQQAPAEERQSHPPRMVKSTVGLGLLQGDLLDLVIAPGDVLVVRGSGRLMEIGTAGGFLGHVLVVIHRPRSVWRDSLEGRFFSEVWPACASEIWLMPTLECTRAQQGLHIVETMVYVDPATNKLHLLGEFSDSEDSPEICLCPNDMLEVWQSPRELRRQLRVDLMQEVIRDMKANESNWSPVTAVRAGASSLLRRLTSTLDSQDSMQYVKDLQACWTAEPICTSVVVVFWQRYLCRVANLSAEFYPKQAQQLAAVLRRWMPLKADRALPGDLLSTMADVGWVLLTQIPQVFQPVVHHAINLDQPPERQTSPPSQAAALTMPIPPSAGDSVPAPPVFDSVSPGLGPPQVAAGSAAPWDLIANPFGVIPAETSPGELGRTNDCSFTHQDSKAVCDMVTAALRDGRLSMDALLAAVREVSPQETDKQLLAAPVAHKGAAQLPGPDEESGSTTEDHSGSVANDADDGAHDDSIADENSPL